MSRPFWCPMTMTGSPDAGPAADDRRVVPVGPVAVELDEVGEDALQM
jgi:hypothetical protein